MSKTITTLPYATLTTVDDNGDVKIKELSYDDIHMKPQRTKPTTQECIDWLWHDKEDPWSPESTIKAETIRAQLLAAQEMAKALEYYANPVNYYTDGKEYAHGSDMAKQALTAWRNAGGEI